MRINLRDWFIALVVGVALNAGAILLFAMSSNSNLEDLERAAGPSIQVTDAQGMFSDVEGNSPEEVSAQEQVDDIDPVEPPVEVAEAKPLPETPVERVQEVTESPTNEAVAVLPQEQKPQEVKKPEKKPEEVKKPKKKKTEKKAPQKKRLKQKKGSKRSSTSNKGKQKKVAGKAATSRYLGLVRSRVMRRKRNSSKKGRVRVSFTISKSGGVSGISASGNPALANLARGMVRSAAPFPPLPPGVGPRSLRANVTINFK